MQPFRRPIHPCSCHRPMTASHEVPALCPPHPHGRRYIPFSCRCMSYAGTLFLAVGSDRLASRLSSAQTLYIVRLDTGLSALVLCAKRRPCLIPSCIGFPTTRLAPHASRESGIVEVGRVLTPSEELWVRTVLKTGGLNAARTENFNVYVNRLYRKSF